jgi:hypothetical protein
MIAKSGVCVVSMVLLLGVATLSPALAIEIKQPLGPEEELKVSQDSRSISVSGETFSYKFSKQNGLIESVCVLGREITDEVPIPNLVLAEHFNADLSSYAARHETAARVTLVEAGPARVVIQSEGTYVAEDGKKFPLQYAVSYDISIDGVILVAVNNTALEDCMFRWLTLSGGAVRSEFAKFLNWMPEQSSSQSTRYEFRRLSEVTGDKALAGTWIPWIWIGDQRRGLEVTTWNVNTQTYHNRDWGGDPNQMFAVWKEPGRVRWENFLVRRTLVYARKGWQRGGEFVLAVTPSKKFDPKAMLLKGVHLGPHQHQERLTLPNEEQIRTLAQNGYNLMLGVANWRSGQYIALNDAALRRTIDLCHKYGMKIIPYVTLNDLAHSTEEFRVHGEEWAIEPTTEFVHRSYWEQREELDFTTYRNFPERETTLMCPAAEGWREHWKKTIDRLARDYEFDGLYIDFWVARMVCENARHGCGGRFRKHTVLGARDMLTYAYNRFKSKDPDAIIKASTNLLVTALVTSLLDIRLVGESKDITQLDPPSRQWLYSSYRLGQSTEFLWATSRWNLAEKATFAALVNFLPKYWLRPPFNPRKGFDDFDVFRFFEAGRGDWNLGISLEGPATVRPQTVSTNTVTRGDARLMTLVNTAASPVMAKFGVSTGRVVYEPLAEQFIEPSAGECTIDLKPGAYRHVIVSPRFTRPHLLFALGARKRVTENWDAAERRLRFSVDGVVGAPIRFSVYSTEGVRSVVHSRGEPVPFEWTPESCIASFETIHVPGDIFEVTF